MPAGSNTICAVNTRAVNLLSCEVDAVLTDVLPTLNLKRMRRKLASIEDFRALIRTETSAQHELALLVCGRRFEAGGQAYDLLEINDISTVMADADIYRSYAQLAESRLQQMEDRLSSFPEENSDPVLASAPDGILTYRNPAFDRLQAELHMASEFEVLPDNHTALVVEAISSPAEFLVAETTADGRVFQWKYRAVLEGTLVHMYGTELTATRDAERARKQVDEKLSHALRIASLGHLAGGIAHDFNNILTTVIGCAQLSIDEFGDDEFVRENLGEILQASERAAEIVDQILAFSSVDEADLHPVSIQSVVREALGRQVSSLTDRIVLREELSNIRGQSGMVLGDEDQLVQVFVNLVSNAVHAIGAESGTVDIRASVVPVAEGSENWIRIEVTDDGVGMNQETISHVFDPYYTTGALGEGRGLGLSAVHGIVTKYHGKIEVLSDVGQGSTFAILLPQYRGVTAPAVRRDGLQTLTTAGECLRVMVVDDEPSVARVTSMMLERYGHTVTICHDPLEALDTLNTLAFDCLVTDHAMPGMTGVELTSSARLIQPDLHVIICSGYGARLDEAKVLSAGAHALLWKPIDFGRLGELVAAGARD